MTSIVFENVTKRFGSTTALNDFSMTIESGELVCLLGPSGCGKTTALRILAGFERPDEGRVLVDGSSIVDVAAQHRGFGMVFQSYSLFPNMTAAGNIGFPLQIRRSFSGDRRQRVRELLAVTGLSDHADKYPHQLSGGQQQRVALARALAIEPPVLLLDEPLSALDAAVREQLRDEIRRLQLDLGITTVFVTHDQHEALAIADRIGVMEGGRLIQIDKPAVIYREPATDFVSSFVGSRNQLTVEADGSGRPTILGTVVNRDVGAVIDIRPEDIVLSRDGQLNGGDGVRATVTAVSFAGPLTRVTALLGRPAENGKLVEVDTPSRDVDDLSIGDEVTLRLSSGSQAG